MLVSDFHFELPEELIAQQPAPERSASRMLALDRVSGAWSDDRFANFPEKLCAGDVLVLNNSRVIPARLFAQREGHAGRIEVLLTAQQSEWAWTALVKPGKKVQVGQRLRFVANGRGPEPAEMLRAEVVERGEYGERTLQFEPGPRPFFEVLDEFGHVPLPPYIRHEDAAEDRQRYQTVYAREHGSVAVPTAGLHFTEPVLQALRERGVQVCMVTLHVGLGTFQPLRVQRVDEVQLHAERYSLPEETAAALNAAKREGRRVIAAGTTTVRTLEHCGQQAGDAELVAQSGSTDIFISPGYCFRRVDALLTNFHLPQSSLLMLVAAFAGVEHTLAAYRHAVAERYRFFSYGDCMFIS